MVRLGRSSLIIFIIFITSSFLSLHGRRDDLSFGDLLGGRHELLDKARAMETFLDIREGLVDKLRVLEERDGNGEAIKGCKDSLRRVDAALKPLSMKDATLRVAIGKESWDVIKDLDTDDVGVRKLIGYGVGLKGAKVLGDRVEDAFSRSFGNFLSDILYGGVSKTKKSASYLFDRITLREGSAFDYDEVLAWQKILKKTLTGLIRRARKSSMIGQRDKIIRSIDDEEAVDVAWKWQRDIYEKEFRGVAERIETYLKYYKKDKDGEAQIIKYSSLIRDWLIGFVDNCLLKTKTHKDLGSGSNLVSLNNLKDELDNYFGILLHYISPSSSDGKKEVVSDSARGRRYLDDDDDDDDLE